MSVRLADLGVPTYAEVQALHRSVAKPPTRLAERLAATKADAQALDRWRRAVYARDKSLCRCCGVRTSATIALDPKRREAHHVHGRSPALRCDVRAGLCLCLACHQRCTGSVGQPKLRVVGTKHFTLAGRRYVDCTAPVRFQETR